MAALHKQSDKDLADTGRMLIAEFEKISVELAKRGIEKDITTYYDGKITVAFNRVTTEKV